MGMHISKQMTVEGLTVQEAFDKTLEYVKRLGYQVVDIKPGLAFTKKTIIDEDGHVAELWLSISVLGEHFVTVFMDYQLRSKELGEELNRGGQYLAEIEKEYEELWHMLRHYSRAAYR